MPRQYNYSNVGASLPNDAKKFYSNILCTDERKEIEQEAWSSAWEYAKALLSWRVNGSHQNAMDLYMGSDSRGPLGKVIQGAASMPY